MLFPKLPNNIAADAPQPWSARGHTQAIAPDIVRSMEEWALARDWNQRIAEITGVKGAIHYSKGRFFWPLEPDHAGNDFDIETIAQGQSAEPRWLGMTTFGGEVVEFKVAQHAVLTSYFVERYHRKLVPKWDWDNDGNPALWALFHDVTETWLRDVSSPVKGEFPDYRAAEDRLAAKLISVFDIPMSQAIREVVRRTDTAMMFWERDAIMGEPVVPYTNEIDHPGGTIYDFFPDFRVWSAAECRDRFLYRFFEIVNA